MEQPTVGDGVRVGSRFGPYLLTRLLGRGGFGEVFEAEDTEKNRLVALKLMSAACSEDPVFRQRLFREASAAGRLNDPHVVPVHSYGEIDGQLYIDMRLINGRDLASVLASEGALAPERAVWVVRQIASALDAAHGAGLVHRDVKPANMLLTGEDFACLVDFGLANAASDTKLTSTGTTIGTLAYMSPERFTHLAEVDHRADVYALACVLFECLTGSQPYPAGDLPALMGAHLSAPVPCPSHYRPQVPAGLDEVIARGMAKDPAGRYQSAGEFARAAQRALAASGPRRQVDGVLVGNQVGALSPTQAAVPVLVPTTQARVAPPLPSPERKGKPRRWNWRLSRRAARTVIAVEVVVVVAIVGGILGTNHRSSSNAHRTAPSTTQETSASPEPPQPLGPGESELPFTGLKHPTDVAVDGAGSVYVSDHSAARVLKLPAGSTDQTVLPFVGLERQRPIGMAADATGAVYITDYDAVLMLPPGATGQTELPPLPDDATFDHLAVDGAGSVYATADQQIWKLAAGSEHWTELPFTGLGIAVGIAVNAAGTVYVTDSHYDSKRPVDVKDGRVLMLTAGSSNQVELPFSDLTDPRSVGVDAADNVYVLDANARGRLWKLTAGSPKQTEVPFSGFLTGADRIAVDGKGNIYILNKKFTGHDDRVLKLAAR